MGNKFESYNMTEKMVDYKLKELIFASKICTCERCTADVRALALNELPPKYTVSRIGEIVTEFELLSIQEQANIIMAIMYGINIVAQSPHHDKEGVKRI